MTCRNVADIAPDHLFLRQRLAFVLLRTMIVVMMDHSTAAVVSQLRGGYRGTLQITPQVFDAVPGSPGFLREVDFPVTPVLSLQIASPLSFIANVAQTWQAAGFDKINSSVFFRTPSRKHYMLSLISMMHSGWNIWLWMNLNWHW